jgi:hypothetical protein
MGVPQTKMSKKLQELSLKRFKFLANINNFYVKENKKVR